MQLKEIANTKNIHEFYKKDVALNIDKHIPIAIDVGYSSVKICSQYGMHNFPSFVIPLEDEKNIITMQDDDIMYREGDKIWLVGNLALNSVERSEIVHYKKHYSREKIQTKEYQILARVAMFLGLIKNDQIVTDKKIYIKTGLPELFLEEDSNTVKNVFVGIHNYEIKFGNKDWKSLSLNLAKDQVGVLSQPFGTIWSIATDVNGIIKNNGVITNKRSLVIDVGFYSADFFLNNHGTKSSNSTSLQLGMFNVLNDTANDIFEKTGTKAKVYEIKKYMLSTKFPFQMFYGADNQSYNFKEDLIRNLKKVSDNIVEEAKLFFNNFREIDVVILSGGASIAMKEYMNFPHNVEIMLPENFIFANCQGFFSCLIAQLKEIEG